MQTRKDHNLFELIKINDNQAIYTKTRSLELFPLGGCVHLTEFKSMNLFMKIVIRTHHSIQVLIHPIACMFPFPYCAFIVNSIENAYGTQKHLITEHGVHRDASFAASIWAHWECLCAFKVTNDEEKKKNSESLAICARDKKSILFEIENWRSKWMLACCVGGGEQIPIKSHRWICWLYEA